MRPALLAIALLSCNGDVPAPTAVQEVDVHGLAKGCFVLKDGTTTLQTHEDGFRFARGDGTAFFLQPSDLGTYLLYDPDGGYVVAEDGPLLRQTELQSDVLLVDDTYVSGAEWLLEASPRSQGAYQLRNRRTNRLLGPKRLTGDPLEASAVRFVEAEGCAVHPEMSLDATGTPKKTTFANGDLYGIVDSHSHILSNFGFGGGGIYHGGAFHRLGVEHALPDCAPFHGEMGRKDFFGFANRASGDELESFLPEVIIGELSNDNHHTDGWPTFTDWPDAREHRTHQQQYYRWLERAYLAGLRLVVQHATSNSVMCNVTAGAGTQPARYDCEDMTAVDRIIDETWNMERYIDAQHGGPGEGWFRVVRSPAEARTVIEDGKMAVVIGIEASDLFRCHLTRRPDGPLCDEAYVDEQLDAYWERGVRALFPVHKFDNAFAPGDGSGDFIEAGNFLNSGHWTNMTEDCPQELSGNKGFDDGDVVFGGLLQPRDEYVSEPPNDLSAFPDDPILAAAAFLPQLTAGAVEGDFCQNAGLTDVGEHLVLGMMKRGMILELDHLPQWAYLRVFELLEEHRYPAMGTHGRHWDGKLYELGGLSITGFGRCRNPDVPGATVQGFLDRIAFIESKGGFPSEGFGFDLNGFAGAPGPRFGDEGCSTPQDDPISYPFASYDGGVEFSRPFLGERPVDFDTEGMIHIGLLPELLEEARADAVDPNDIEPIFRSAEAYVRMWELSEKRGRAIGR